MNSNPIVEIVGSDPVEKVGVHKKFMQQELDKCSFTMGLATLGKHLNFQHQVLTMTKLQAIKDNYCRILIIDQPMFDPDGKLCVEENIGELKRLNEEEIYSLVKPTIGEIKIDVVFINTAKGESIANAFHRVGIPHVFYFQHEQPLDEASTTELREFMCYHNFQIIQRLVTFSTVFQAFSLTNKQIKETKKFKESFRNCAQWMKKDPNLNGMRLYNELSVDERQKLADGDIEDTTQIINTTNVNSQSSEMIGRNRTMHDILLKLTDSKYKLVEINGSQGMGKTKLAMEISKFIIQRKMFFDQVYFIDFRNIDSQKALNEKLKQHGIQHLI